MMASGLASRLLAKEALQIEALHTAADHGKTTMLVQTRNLPVAPDPEIAKVVGSAESIRLRDSDKLTNQALPKVKTVCVRLQLGVGHRDERLVVRNSKNIAIIKLGELLSRRVTGVLANNLGLEFVVRGLYNNVLGRRDLSEIDIVFVGPDYVSNDSCLS